MDARRRQTTCLRPSIPVLAGLLIETVEGGDGMLAGLCRPDDSQHGS